MGGPQHTFPQADCAFFQQDPIAAETNAFPLAHGDFAAVNPNTVTAPVFRTRRDADITLAIYRRPPVLVDRRATPARFVWPVRYMRMFDMTNDSGKFRTEQELVAAGAYRVTNGGWEKGSAKWLPLMTGRSIHHYDHRAASVVENSANLHNPFSSGATSPAEHADPSFSPRPQFWVSEGEVDWPASLGWGFAFRDVARPTDARTVISTLVPRAGFGNKAPLLLPDALSVPETIGAGLRNDYVDYQGFAPLLAANFGAFIFDFVARQKVQGANLNSYIVEQLPIIPPEAYARRFGPRSAEDIVRQDVLHLTYTAHDMKAFAHDQGYDGPPFAWDDEDRLRRRARLDAVFFHLYGLDRDDAAYVLSTFPIVKREEEQRYQGRFRSRDLILGTMAALSAGAPDANVAG